MGVRSDSDGDIVQARGVQQISRGAQKRQSNTVPSCVVEKGPTVFPGQIRPVTTHREPVVKSTGASVLTRVILSESGADTTSLSLVTDACLRRSDPAVGNCF